MEAAGAAVAAGEAARGGESGRCCCCPLPPGRGFSACAAVDAAAAACSFPVSDGPASVLWGCPMASCRSRLSAGSFARALCAGRQRCLHAACVLVVNGSLPQLHDVRMQGCAQLSVRDWQLSPAAS